MLVFHILLAGQGERPSMVLRVPTQGLMLANLEYSLLPSGPKCSERDRLRCSPRRFLLDFLEEDCTAFSDSRLKAFRAGFPTLQAVSFLSPRAASEWMGMCKKVSKNLAENHSPQMPFKSLPTESFIRHVTRESGAWS